MTAAVIAALGILALLPFAFRAWGNRRYRQGLFDGQMAAQHRQLDERWAQFKGRHRAGQPRTSPAPDPSPAQGTRPGDAMVPGENPGQRPAVAPMKQRHLITAAGETAPVFAPRDDTHIPMRPQPPAHPERPTAALPAATTGEMRAATDHFIMRMREDTEAHIAEKRLS